MRRGWGTVLGGKDVEKDVAVKGGRWNRRREEREWRWSGPAAINQFFLMSFHGLGKKMRTVMKTETKVGTDDDPLAPRTWTTRR